MTQTTETTETTHRTENPTENSIENPPATPRTPKRVWLFRLIALLIIPVLFVLALETGLRIAGYGFSPAALVKHHLEDRTAYSDNPRMTQRFFPAAVAREPDPFIFFSPKPAKTYRIFVMGGSAAQGVPEGAFSFSRILRIMLENAYPGTRFEVINTAITAINSHVVREIARDCAQHQPDLFVLYMGNNEVVGPYGAGTIFGRITPNLGLIRAGIYLKGTRLGQWLGSLLGFGPGNGNDKKAGQWRGLEMFLEKQLRADDPQLQYVYSHFRANLEDIRRTARQAGIPVVFSTVACNLRDSPPFGSLHRRDLGASQLEEWQQHYRRGAEQESAGQFESALDAFGAAARIDDHYAELRFRMGLCSLALGRLEDAREHFHRAREQDTLRFRVDQRINDIIRRTAQESDPNHVILADAEKAFADNGRHHIPGGEFFYEHVHMNFRGNYLLARTIFRRISGLPAPATPEPGAAPPELSMLECARRLAFSPWDRFNLSEEMLHGYIKNPPYSNQLYHQRRVELLENQLQRLSAALEPAALKESARLHEAAIHHSPDDWRLHAKYARLLFKDMKNYPGATQHYQRVTELLPHSDLGYAGLGFVLRLQGDLGGSVKHNLGALERNPQNAQVHNNLAFTYQMAEQPDKAEKHYRRALGLQPHFIAAYHNLGLMLAANQRRDKAETLLRRGLEQNPNSWQLHSDLGSILHQQDRNTEAMDALRRALEINPGAQKARTLMDQLESEKK